MKKYLLLSAATCLFAAQAHAYGNAYGNSYGLEPYIGFDLGATHIKSSGDELDGSGTVGAANLNLGVKFNPYFGLELSTQASGDTDVDGVGDLSYSDIGIDAVGYLPLNYQWELFGMAGIGYYDFDIELDHKVNGWRVHYDKNETAFRAGLGAQYHMNDNWAVRGLVRYHHIDSKYIDYVSDFMIGLKYKF